VPKARSKNKCLQMARLTWQAAKLESCSNQTKSRDTPCQSCQYNPQREAQVAQRRRTRGRATGNSPLASSPYYKTAENESRIPKPADPAKPAINTKPNHLSHRHTPIAHVPTPGQAQPSCSPAQIEEGKTAYRSRRRYAPNRSS